LYSALTGDETIPADRLAMVDTLQGPLWQVALMFVAGALLVPFGEELIFRGVIFGWLRSSAGYVGGRCPSQ
jgi:membrane protease YdiL (CAAX protease family)